MKNPISSITKFLVGMLLVGNVVTLNLTTWAMGTRVPVEGSPAAEFKLSDLDGQSHSLSQYRGKVVLLNFWATWCKPCTQEMPAMQEAFDHLRDKGLVVLAVNELEELQEVRGHIREHGHTFPVLLDPDNHVANLYGVFGLPVTVFIDQQGVVHEYLKGGLLTKERIFRIFDTLTASAQKLALQQ